MTVGFFVTLIVALLAGLGVGSAGLFMTWLTLVEKVPQLTAQGINLIFFIFSSGSAFSSCFCAVDSRKNPNYIYF